MSDVTMRLFAKRERGRAGAIVRVSVLVLIVTAHVACTSRIRSEPATPAQIVALETRLASDASSGDARVQLGAAYRSAGRAADAVSVLEPAAQEAPRDAGVQFLLATSYEAAGRWSDARRSYEMFLASSGPSRLNRRARARLELIERRELEQAVRDAVARERSLGAAIGDSRTVGVFPFISGTTDESLRPLGSAIAELLTTDLAQTDRVIVVERTQVRLLLDEIGLARTGAVDDATAARAGRLLGAARIVQGRVDGGETELRMQAAVVNVGVTAAAVAPILEQGTLAQLFDTQKRLALALYEGLGVQLTVAERERVLRRSTDNVQALLAFGFGLEAHDAGLWTEAIGRFEQALALDDRFELARIWLERARRRAEAEADDLEELAALASVELGWDLPGWRRRRLPFSAIDPLVPNPDVRNPVPELFGVEGLDRRARVEVIVRPPGGR